MPSCPTYEGTRVAHDRAWLVTLRPWFEPIASTVLVVNRSFLVAHREPLTAFACTSISTALVDHFRMLLDHCRVSNSNCTPSTLRPTVRRSQSENSAHAIAEQKKISPDRSRGGGGRGGAKMLPHGFLERIPYTSYGIISDHHVRYCYYSYWKGCRTAVVRVLAFPAPWKFPVPCAAVKTISRQLRIRSCSMRCSPLEFSTQRQSYEYVVPRGRTSARKPGRQRIISVRILLPDNVRTIRVTYLVCARSGLLLLRGRDRGNANTTYSYS